MTRRSGNVYIAVSTRYVTFRQVVHRDFTLRFDWWDLMAYVTARMRREVLDADPRACTQDLVWTIRQ